MFTLNDFKGIIPALITPYGKNGNFDPNCSKEMVEWLLSLGVGGFYLTGSNGTGVYMDTDERIRVVDTITEQINGRVPVVAHIASASTQLSVKMASEAEKSGCTATSAVPSYYFKLSLPQMVEYYSQIAEAANIPLIVYAQTDKYEPSVEMFKELNKIENVAGVKYTGPNHYMMGRIKQHLGKDFKVYSGMDEMILSGFLYGADAAIGGTYNVIPDLYIRCVDKFLSGNISEAQKELMAANAIVELLLKYDGAASMHACFEFVGVNAGYNLSPTPNLDEFEKATFKKELIELKNKLDIEPIALFNAI